MFFYFYFLDLKINLISFFLLYKIGLLRYGLPNNLCHRTCKKKHVNNLFHIFSKSYNVIIFVWVRLGPVIMVTCVQKWTHVIISTGPMQLDIGSEPHLLCLIVWRFNQPYNTDGTRVKGDQSIIIAYINIDIMIKG